MKSALICFAVPQPNEERHVCVLCGHAWFGAGRPEAGSLVGDDRNGP